MPIDHKLYFCIIALSFFMCSKAVASNERESAPQPAVEHGYLIKTYAGGFSEKTIDLENTKRKGFSWYPWDLFGKKSDATALKLNPDESVTLLGDTTGAHGQLVTAVQKKSPPFFVGKAFGGGAYIEAEIKFDKNAVSASATKNVPAFWALQMEGDILKSQGHWPHQPEGYKHNIEVDIFESIRNPANMPENSYGGSMHDWYGIYKETCPKGLCQEKMPYREGMRIVPKDINFSVYHKYGFLWVPAKEGSKGIAAFYFDGKQIGPTRYWETYKDQPPPPINQPWAFGILDHRHIYLILGTGLNQPMTVRSVNVWQKDEGSNLINN